MDDTKDIVLLVEINTKVDNIEKKTRKVVRKTSSYYEEEEIRKRKKKIFPGQ